MDRWTTVRRESEDDPGRRSLVAQQRGQVALPAPLLADDPAGALFREAVLLPDAIRRLPALVGS